MLNALRSGKAADVSAADNFKTFACCEAAYKSAETGKAVKPQALQMASTAKRVAKKKAARKRR
jgi:hypothetical protein